MVGSICEPKVALVAYTAERKDNTFTHCQLEVAGKKGETLQQEVTRATCILAESSSMATMIPTVTVSKSTLETS